MSKAEKSQNDSIYMVPSSLLVLMLNTTRIPWRGAAITARRNYHASLVLTKEFNSKRVDNIKRKFRYEKRLPSKLNSIQDYRNLAESFEKQRAAVVRLFNNDSNIDALFPNSEIQLQLVSDLSELVQELDSPLTYPDYKIQNSILLLVNSLINTVLVELNLRKLFKGKDLPRVTTDNLFLFRNLMKEMKDDTKKVEILKILSKWYDINTSGKPESMNAFMKKLKAEPVKEFMEDDLKRLDDFNSIEQYRSSFEYFKSSSHLNYEDSDCIKSVASNNMLQFKSSEINNNEFLSKFEQSFNDYQVYLTGVKIIKRESSESNPLGMGDIYKSLEHNISNLKHLDLVLSVCQTLLTSNRYTPSVGIFKYLLDKFGNAQLYNYQSLVYQSLPFYEFKPIVLANRHIPMENIHSLITEDTSILESLLKYQIIRQDVDKFKELLSFLGLNEVNSHEKVLSKSFLSGMLSKSRYMRSAHGLDESDQDLPGVINVNSIYTAIDGCIELKQFEYIDLLFNKILIHGIEDNEVKVLLHLDKEFKDQLLISKYANAKTEVISRKIFTKGLIKLLIKASRESDDMGRLMWLVPHLDTFLEANIPDNIAHIERIKVHINGQSNEEKEEFHKLDAQATIDKEMIQEIYDSLHQFGLEGKILTYDRVLDFNKTVIV